MNRKEELLSIIPEEATDLVKNTINEMVFLENQLLELKELPFIKVNPKNPAQQKHTAAFKMYKELLQQYTNCIKLVEAVIYRDKKLSGNEVEESPLRKWFTQHGNSQ